MRYRRSIVVFLLIFGCAGCDQSTKFVAQTYLDGKPQISLWSDLVRLELFENSGGFLSLGASLPKDIRTLIFLIAVPFILMVITAFVLTSRSLRTQEIIAISLIIGGGLGNLIDRYVNDGRVIDFLNVGIGWLRTGVFNFADVVLLFASFYLILFMSKTEESEHRR